MLADIHGNAVALEAVLAEVEREEPDLVVFGGDLTWGPLPRETIALLRRFLDDIDVSKESAVVLMDELRSRALARSEKTNRRLTLVATVLGVVPLRELANDAASAAPFS